MYAPRTLTIALSAALFAAPACAALDDSDDPVGVEPTAEQLADAEPMDLAPLATLELANGSVLDYYEADPGAILIVENGPQTNAPALAQLDGRLTDAVAIYRALAPDRPVPEALAAAAARARPREVEAASVRSDQAGLWNNWFSEEFCTSPGAEFSFCLLDQTVSNSRFYADAFHMRSAALANYGTVRFLFYRKRWYDGWKLLWDQNVSAGYYSWYQFTESGIDDPDLWTGVVDVAAGEQYDFGGTGIW